MFCIIKSLLHVVFYRQARMLSYDLQSQLLLLITVNKIKHFSTIKSISSHLLLAYCLKRAVCTYLIVLTMGSYVGFLRMDSAATETTDGNGRNKNENLLLLPTFS